MAQPNTTQVVQHYLSKDLSIQKNLQRGILNIRALANQIRREQNIKSSVDSVISAIRRFTHNKKFQEEYLDVHDVLRDSTVATKNNVSCITLKNQSDIYKYLTAVTKMMDLEKRETLRLIKAKKTLKMIVDAEKSEELKDFFLNENIEVKDNLSEIRIKTSLKADDTKGVVARISNELLLQDINICELIFCTPEIIIYINQEDFLKAYESLMKLCKGE